MWVRVRLRPVSGLLENAAPLLGLARPALELAVRLAFGSPPASLAYAPRAGHITIVTQNYVGSQD